MSRTFFVCVRFVPLGLEPDPQLLAVVLVVYMLLLVPIEEQALHSPLLRHPLDLDAPDWEALMDCHQVPGTVTPSGADDQVAFLLQPCLGLVFVGAASNVVPIHKMDYSTPFTKCQGFSEIIFDTGPCRADKAPGTPPPKGGFL